MGLTKDLGALPKLLTVSGSNVGVGTTSPTSKLTVNGQIALGDPSTYQSTLYDVTGVNLISSNPANGLLTVGDSFIVRDVINSTVAFKGGGSSEVMRFSSLGNIGIGTTTPINGGSAAKWITAEGTTNYGGGFISSLSGNAKAYFYSQDGYATVQGSSGQGIKLMPNGGEGVTVLSGGDVGIGTTTPSYKLEVAGGDISVGNNAWYRVKSTSGATQRVIGIDGGNNVYVGGIDTGISNVIFRTGGAERARLTSAGLQFQNGSSSLNYYEEGTFTPTAVSTTFAPATPTSGKYVRIGNQVSITCAWSVAPGGTGMKYLVFDLPFAMATGGNFTGAVSNYNSGLSAYSSNVGTTVRNSSGSSTQQYVQAVFTTNTVTNIYLAMTYFTF